MVCSVASFCRELEVHVDIDGVIGPLVDADSSVHKLGSLLANYMRKSSALSASMMCTCRCLDWRSKDHL